MNEYRFHKVPRYSELKAKLLIILSDNKLKDSFKYLGTQHNNTLGILVKGTDSSGIRTFEKFFSIKDINYYFNKNHKRD